MMENDTIPGAKGGYLIPYKKGQSGNPKGKPKGIKDTKSIINKLFTSELEDSETGEIMTIHELIILQMCRRALVGDLKATEWLVEQKEGPIGKRLGMDDVTPEPSVSQIDMAKRYAEKYVESQRKKT